MATDLTDHIWTSEELRIFSCICDLPWDNSKYSQGINVAYKDVLLVGRSN